MEERRKEYSDMRDMVVDLTSRFYSHEEVCAIRYGEIKETTALASKSAATNYTKLEDAINNTNRLILGFSCGGFILVLGAAATLAFYLLTHGR